MSFDEIMTGIRRFRTSIRTSTGRPDALPRDKIQFLGQKLTANLQNGGQVQNQLQHLQASRNPTPTKGALQSQTFITPQPRTRLLDRFLQRPPPPQPNPPTQEELAEIEKQRTLKGIENKALAEKQKKRRLGLMRGLNVNRS